MEDQLIQALARHTGVAQPPLTSSEVLAFGHFATPVALQLAKDRGQSPMGIAAELAVALMGDEALQGYILNTEVKAPGFVNIRLTDAAHHAALQELVAQGPRVPQVNAGKKAIVESASINVAKPVHAGHLRNTAFGAAFARILEATGMQVVRWNYLGDWGTQFGKVVVAYRTWGSEERLAADPITELAELYARFHREVAENPALEDEARAAFRALEQGDPEVRALWQRFRDASVAATEPFFTELQAPFDIWDGEASLEGDLQGVITELQEAGLLEESEGARVVRLDAEGLPVALIQKSDGASLYLTRDLALLKKRLTQYSDTLVYYVVANEQSLNFQQLFAIGKKLGWPVERAMHLKYGLVLGADGKKLSGRKGGAITAQEVLDEAEVRVGVVEQAREERLPKGVVRQMGTSAVVYAMTKDVRTSDIRFDWDRLLDFRGDSGPYLQYTQARLGSLVAKAGGATATDFASLADPRELELVRLLDRYSAAVVAAAAEFQTSHLALYLYTLASKVNTYYQAVPILKDEDSARQQARVALLEAARTVLVAGMQLLGVRVIERV